MKVQEVMCDEIKTCRPDEDLNRVAQLMWDHDFGVVPVVNEDGVLLGVITDRDVCMAAYTRGQPLGAIRVDHVMSRQVYSCGPGSNVEIALSLMKEARVRRLPVIDGEGALVGLLSLNDLIQEAKHRSRQGDPQLAVEVADALAVISEPRYRTIQPAPPRTLEPVAKSPARRTGTLVS